MRTLRTKAEEEEEEKKENLKQKCREIQNCAVNEMETHFNFLTCKKKSKNFEINKTKKSTHCQPTLKICVCSRVKCRVYWIDQCCAKLFDIFVEKIFVAKCMYFG